MHSDPAPAILVVDDEPRVCELLNALLKRQGYDVQTCHSADDALQCLAQRPFDMVITDLKMPGTNGLSLIQKVKAMKADIAAVMVTGYATVETAVDALRHGADDYVTKPFNVEELRKVVGRALHARQLARDNQRLMQELETVRSRPRSAHHAPLPAAPTPRSNRLVEINTSLSAITDADHLCSEALDLLCPELRVVLASVMTFTEDRRSLVVKAKYGDTDHVAVGQRQVASHGVAGWVAQHREPLLIQDLQRAPLFRNEPAERFPSGSLLLLPLLYDGELCGVLNLHEKEGGAPFEESDLHFARPAANQLAVSLHTCSAVASLRAHSVTAIRQIADLLDARPPSSACERPRGCRISATPRCPSVC